MGVCNLGHGRDTPDWHCTSRRTNLCAMRLITLMAVIITAALATLSSQPIPQDTGAAGAWQKINKLKTTASVLHGTAHPDDEHGGVLAKLSRGDGARVMLLTLTRGESGDNAIGPQLFDALGLIRTDELLTADKYYGVDEQYFSTMIDYGFSKRLDETTEKWGLENAFRDVVRVIRMTRPWIVLSRFQGNARDGHGNHSAAGVLSQQASEAAGDPNRFPEQIKEGLRPWSPLKVYMGGVRANENWTVRIDSGEYNPVLGDSYTNIAAFGLSFQRSQNGGRYAPTFGPSYSYYTRTASRVNAPDKENSIFDGVDTTYAGLFKTLRRTAPAGVDPTLAGIDAAVARAISAFRFTDPTSAVPALAEGLKLTRDVIDKSATDPDVLHVLRIKERQFQDAITAALGLELSAFAEPSTKPPASDTAGRGGGRGVVPLMTAPVQGQTFGINVRFTNRAPVSVQLASILMMPTPGYTFTTQGGQLSAVEQQVGTFSFAVKVADDAPISSKPYFSRSAFTENRYTLADPSMFGRPFTPSPLIAVATYTINGVEVQTMEVVKRREANLPYGYVTREVRTVPRLALTVSPTTAIVPLSSRTRTVDLDVVVMHNASAPTTGQLALALPSGWTSTPAQHAFAFQRPGERTTYRFKVSAKTIDTQLRDVVAVATADGKQYKEGYELIEPRDLEARYLYRPATAKLRGVDVEVVPNLKVGYVMGIGDQVPLGLQQLGATVTLLTERDLATADLSVYDAIMTGTRAYAVREDLKTYNTRLLDYVKNGGNMIVLYNTFELVPNQFAPFPGELLASAEEVSEEDSPITILAPTDQAFNWPNKITVTDFNDWVEQRGSKFWTSWDKAYTPMISTFDKGQAPQPGGWLTAKYGNGHWTYFAYALHRQLPYGVPGAFRITANLLALGKVPATASSAPPPGSSRAQRSPSRATSQSPQ
jgi:LmbE family N-acetylglucosaminyl deacetylase